MSSPARTQVDTVYRDYSIASDVQNRLIYVHITLYAAERSLDNHDGYI